MTISKTDFPDYLDSYGDLSNYFQSQFDHLLPIDRGRKFMNLVIRLFPLSKIGESYFNPVPSEKESHDKGIDGTAEHKEGEESMFIQSKYKIPGIEQFDSIISKFKDFESPAKKDANSLFPSENPKSENKYLIITLSKLDNIVSKYKATQRSSRSFYKKLENEKRIFIIDGLAIFNILQIAFRKLHVLPTDFTLEFESNFLNQDMVYVGLINATKLAELYNKFGDSLFLENIREYLGEKSGKIAKNRETVNKAILSTLNNDPESFLARNNGITFRANRIEKVDAKNIKLHEASIVNGCQTTMSIVSVPSPESFVLVKVVQAENSWDIAKATNYQNHISQIDLELAQYIRPQIVRSVATQAGTGFAGSNSTPFALLDEIHKDKVNYNSIRSLFMGLFSKSANNSIENNYTEIKSNILEEFFKDPNNNRVYEILFNVSRNMVDSSDSILDTLSTEEELKELFQRFWRDENTNYRSYLTLLACCGFLNNNIYDENHERNYSETLAFLENLDESIDKNPTGFRDFYFNAFKVVALELMSSEHSRDKILQVMHRKLKDAKFETLYSKLRLQSL